MLVSGVRHSRRQTIQRADDDWPNHAVPISSVQVLELVREVSPKIKAPLVLFTYFNPIFSRGLDNYMRMIKEAGASGLLVPDLPLEGTQTEGVQEAAEKAGIELVLLATPTTGQVSACVTASLLFLLSMHGPQSARLASAHTLTPVWKENAQSRPL